MKYYSSHLHDNPQPDGIQSSFPNLNHNSRSGNAPEEQIAYHVTSAAHLRARLNALLPIARLPPEILGEIFSFYLLATKAIDSWSSQDYRWLVVTHVCHHWREVALNTPGLWTVIAVPGNLERTQAYISRSKQAPLRIVSLPTHDSVTPETQERDLECLQLVAPEFHRAETLVLALRPRAYDAITSRFPSTTPLLKSLEVSVFGNENWFREMAYDESIAVVLDRGAAPSLTNLRIMFYRLDWRKGVLSPSLVSLELLCPQDPTDGVSISEIVAVIRESPLLEFLHLAYILPSFPPSTTSLPPIITPASLPHIQKFYTVSSALASVYFLDHFVIPASAHVWLTIHSMCPNTAIPLLARPLASKLNTRIVPEYSMQPADSLTIDEDGMWFFKRDTKPRDPFAFPHLRLRLSDSNAAKSLVFDELCTHLPLQDVSSLSIHDVSLPAPERPNWFRMFNIMSNVESFTIVCDKESGIPYHHDIISSLGGSSHPNAPMNTLPMQKLRHISMKHVRFRDSPSLLHDLNFVNGLWEILATRKAAGYPVEKVTVQQCPGAKQDDIVLLEKLATVVWDREYEEEEYTDDDGMP